MKKIITLVLVLVAFAAQAQEAPTKGFLLPRMDTAERNAMVNPAKGIVIFNTDTNLQEINTGVFSAPVWEAVGKVTTTSKSFFMPSITIPTNGLAVAQTKDLFAEYYTQFNAPVIKSTLAPASIPTYTASELYYYITYYDTSVFGNVSINASGVMTYDVIGDATACSFINVVFVPKN